MSYYGSYHLPRNCLESIQFMVLCLSTFILSLCDVDLGLKVVEPIKAHYICSVPQGWSSSSGSVWILLLDCLLSD